MTAMEAFEALGVIRWPLTFSLLVVVALALWSLALVWRSAMPARQRPTVSHLVVVVVVACVAGSDSLWMVPATCGF